MRWGFWSSCVWAVAIAASMTGPPPSLGRPQGAPPTILPKRVASFRVERLPLLDALLQLGQDEGVPLGIEYVDREVVEKPISVKLDGATVGEIMERLLGRDRGYSWRVRDGVLTVSHASVRHDEGNLLDHVIPEFSISRCSVSEASHLLDMDLHLELHPQIRGFAGDYSPGDVQNLIGPFKLRNVPVWRVLNRLVSANRKAAWIVQVPQGHLDELPSYGLWTIVEYENPPRRYAAVLRTTIWGLNPNPADRK